MYKRIYEDKYLTSVPQEKQRLYMENEEQLFSLIGNTHPNGGTFIITRFYPLVERLLTIKSLFPTSSAPNFSGGGILVASSLKSINLTLRYSI